MVSRYAIVAEPEALEMDDDVYRADLTIEDLSGSTRSLEPILPGPIGLRTIFYDPSWSPKQRNCCLGIAVVVTCCCIAVLIALFVGLGQVISYINRSDRLKASGLYMIPDLDLHDIAVLVYNPAEKFKPAYRAYADEIDQYLAAVAFAAYRNQSEQLSTTDCVENSAVGKNKVCNFDLNWLGPNCTSETDYGYATGSPCVLFTLRNVGQWRPVISEEFLKTLKLVDGHHSNRLFDQNHIPLSCSIAMFVQIIEPHRFVELHVMCQIMTVNIDELEEYQTEFIDNEEKYDHDSDEYTEFMSEPTDKKSNFACGNTTQFNLTRNDYLYQRKGFPWSVILMDRVERGIKCLGTIIQFADIQHSSNSSDMIVTSPECFGNTDPSIVIDDWVVYYGSYKKRFTEQYDKQSVTIRGLLGVTDSYSAPGFVVLKLQDAIPFSRAIYPACLVSDSNPQTPDQCFTGGFNMRKQTKSEYPTLLSKEIPCNRNAHPQLGHISGVCGYKAKTMNVGHSGAALTCFVNHIGYLYGVYSGEMDEAQNIHPYLRQLTIFAEYFGSAEFTVNFLSNYENALKLRDGGLEPICTASLYIEPNSNVSRTLVTSTQCLKVSYMKKNWWFKVFTGFSSNKSPEDVQNVRLIPVKHSTSFSAKDEALDLNRFGLTLIRLGHPFEVEGIDHPFDFPNHSGEEYDDQHCFTSGLDRSGRVVTVEISLQKKPTCLLGFGMIFNPKAMLCATHTSDNLFYPIGAPLICKRVDSDNYMQVGIRSTVPQEKDAKTKNSEQLFAYVDLVRKAIAKHEIATINGCISSFYTISLIFQWFI
ncbi:putative sodium/potassium-transporting ATPase subunit beta-1 [Trichinella spiralis]|uniref:putative sodium/potassium-transporting ATPase subunit beta-1 n=1 Tax=Trichinella spiralis TaxID=6334 RepID=UPI0001EFC128|nr:putative sodium/potassium-transporting ATPase subunit beta-1 [Trichinella spiralis]